MESENPSVITARNFPGLSGNLVEGEIRPEQPCVGSNCMQYLTLEKKGAAAWIWMNRPPSNDINPEFMDEIIQIHRDLAADQTVRVVALASRNEKFFCNGLDPSYMLSLSIEGRAGVFRKLMTMMREMYAFPKPEIAVINGHAMAGGAVLGVLCDFRLMSANKGRYCFSEIHVGLTIPRSLMNIIESIVGPSHLYDVTFNGKAYRAEEAAQIRLVDQAIPPESLYQSADKFIEKLLEQNQDSMVSIKKNIRSKVLETLSEKDFEKDAGLENFLGGSLVEGLTAVIEKRRPRFNV